MVSPMVMAAMLLKSNVFFRREILDLADDTACDVPS